MKKVILIGRFNEVTRQISESLSQYCRVQLCADNSEIVEGMLKLVYPDLFILSLVGASTAHEEIFSMLSQEAPVTPIIAVGSENNENDLARRGFLLRKEIRFLRRPITVENIVEQAKAILCITPEKKDAAPVEQLKTVLVVDDNPTLLRTMQTMLSKKYRVTFASSGTQAIVAIGRAKPDVILLDYDMPVCDGKMTLQMLRSEEETKDIPVIFLTGLADSEHVREVLSLHPQGYLLKPPEEATIFARLEEVLSGGNGENK